MSETSPPASRNRAILLTLAIFAIAGVVAGLVWPQLISHPRMMMTEQGPFPVSEGAAGQLFGMDGWYAVLGAGLGLVAGVIAFVWFRRHAAWTVAAIAVGSGIAAGLSLVVGTYAGSGEVILAWSPDAGAGTVLQAPTSIRAYGVLAVWPLAALVPALVLAWLLPWDLDPPSEVIHNPEASGAHGPRPGR